MLFTVFEHSIAKAEEERPAVAGSARLTREYMSDLND